MDKPISLSDLENLKVEIQDAMDKDRKYWIVNEVKCDAISTAKSYEEFSERVAAAHLRPLDKKDKLDSGKYKTVWNKYSK